MPTRTLSLCMIAKNEADSIARCINSAKGFVDEIIVVDTGSTDNTKEIARTLGAKVIEETWNNDFSAARNISLEHATGDWILFLDCDEELDLASGPVLREAIQSITYEGYFILVTNTTENNLQLTSPSIRLFRNRKSFRFEGRIHEQIAPAIIKQYGIRSIANINVTIIHHGYDPNTNNIKAKINRNLEILNSYPEEKRDGFFLYNLGTEYLRLGDQKLALENYLKALDLTKPGQAFGPILVKRTIATLMAFDRYRVAIEQLQYYQTIYTEYNDLIYLEAFCHFKCGRFSKAKVCLERYLNMPPPPQWYPTENVYYLSSAQNLMTILETSAIDKEYPGLSVCIIGRDESAQIGQCLQSVNEIARELIYVDSGSTDRSPAIAYQMGAKLYSFPWNNNFADTRNFAVSLAGEEWILILDADEVLPDQSRERIVDLIKDARHDGYLLRVCTFLDRNLSTTNCCFKGSCRLFRKDRYRFQGAVLEEIIPFIPGSGAGLTAADISIHHLHYLAPDTHIARKREWKMEAIREGTADDPRQRDYALGVECFSRQDFQSAASYFASSLGDTEWAGVPDFFYYFGMSLINTGNPARALTVLERATIRYPDYTDLVYLQAIAHFMRGNIEVSEQLFKRCLEMGDAPWEKYLATPGTGHNKAKCSLGTIYARKGNVDRALETFLEAAGLPGAFEQAIESIIFIRDKLSVPIERFLEQNGLLNVRSVSTASRCLAKMGRYKESLKYLALAGDLIKNEPPPRNYAVITQSIDLLLTRYLWHAVQPLPEDSPLRKLSLN